VQADYRLSECIWGVGTGMTYTSVTVLESQNGLIRFAESLSGECGIATHWLGQHRFVCHVTSQMMFSPPSKLTWLVARSIVETRILLLLYKTVLCIVEDWRSDLS
jgi:hypothetical protein